MRGFAEEIASILIVVLFISGFAIFVWFVEGMTTVTYEQAWYKTVTLWFIVDLGIRKHKEKPGE